MPGLFVTFEGGEGTGKSTQIKRLAARLQARGESPIVTREPGGTPLAERIRELILEARSPGGAADDDAPGPWTETFLLEAARSDLVTKVIRPALETGRTVLCDRYDDSTLAYQGGGRGLDRDRLRSLNRLATGGLVPDLSFLFDLRPDLGLQRRSVAGEENRLDREPREFHQRVDAAYRELAAAEPERFVVVPAGLGVDELEGRIWDAFESRSARARGG